MPGTNPASDISFAIALGVAGNLRFGWKSPQSVHHPISTTKWVSFPFSGDSLMAAISLRRSAIVTDPP